MLWRVKREARDCPHPFTAHASRFHRHVLLSNGHKTQSSQTPKNVRSFCIHPNLPFPIFVPLPGLPVRSTAGVYAGGLGWPGGWRAGWPSRWRRGWRGFVMGGFSRGRESADGGEWARKKDQAVTFQRSEISSWRLALGSWRMDMSTAIGPQKIEGRGLTLLTPAFCFLLL